MAVAIEDTHRWTREEYERKAAEGFFSPDARVELIEGIVYDMAPQKSPHATACRLTQEALRSVFPLPSGYEIRGQLPLALSDDSEPEPDVAVVTGSIRDYSTSHPTTALLIIEVADSTLFHDRKRKIPLYARSGILEAWLLDLNRRVLEVYRNPLDGAYRTKLVPQAGDTVSPVARPDASLAIADLLP